MRPKREKKGRVIEERTVFLMREKKEEGRKYIGLPSVENNTHTLPQGERSGPQTQPASKRKNGRVFPSYSQEKKGKRDIRGEKLEYLRGLRLEGPLGACRRRKKKKDNVRAGKCPSTKEWDFVEEKEKELRRVYTLGKKENPSIAAKSRGEKSRID